MGKWRDFFKALATNYDVMNDEYIETELQNFMAENSDSVKRVAEFERKLKVEVPAKKVAHTKPVIENVATPKNNSTKVTVPDNKIDER